MEETQEALCKTKEVHNWQPPCSCGVELNETLETGSYLREEKKGEVHNWQPPCSCGVSLDEVLR